MARFGLGNSNARGPSSQRLALDQFRQCTKRLPVPVSCPHCPPSDGTFGRPSARLPGFLPPYHSSLSFLVRSLSLFLGHSITLPSFALFSPTHLLSGFRQPSDNNTRFDIAPFAFWRLDFEGFKIEAQTIDRDNCNSPANPTFRHPVCPLAWTLPSKPN